jgi:uncharacterized repeat protein (TIGR03833 family)
MAKKTTKIGSKKSTAKKTSNHTNKISSNPESKKKSIYKPTKKLSKEEKLVANDYRRKANIKKGLHVKIEESRYLPNLTEGYVEEILTGSDYHEFGIKVKLTTGQQGRVKEILDKIDKR